MAWWAFALAGAGMGMLRAGQQDQQTRMRIRAMYQQAGWEEDFGDEILDQANSSSKRINRVAYRKSVGIMNASASRAMQIKAQAERNASSLLVKAAGSGADVSGGTPLEVAAMQMEVGDREAYTEQQNARGAIKSQWDDVKWKTNQMKKSAKFQQKMRYAKANQLRAGAQGLEASRGMNAFMNILGGTMGGASMGMQYQQAYGTGDSSGVSPPSVGPQGTETYQQKINRGGGF